ncbi:hypothetical protein KAF25_006269 [Fusarium avenaceum]|uniref:Uncharacterized protein n=1 Tax=Fusarium avenaceum TaxID=40199 RepID=A0A9P7H7N1_9HYPO|nr:hypothetical protein KAF25_006269 [Fusarium avenaceum]
MPFTIAGVLAIFLPETQFDAFLKSYESPRGWERIKYPVDMEVQSLITEEQVLELAKQFPDCSTISQIGPDIWLQFPKVKTKANAGVLKVNSVDEATYRVPWGLARCNGQVLPKAPLMRTLSKAWPSKTHGSKPFAQSNTEEFPRLSSSIDRSKSMFKSNRSISNKVKLEPEDIVTLNRTTKMLAGILVERESKRAVMFPAVSDLDDLETKKVYSSDGQRLLGRILEPVEKSRLQLARLGSGELHNRFQNRNLSICPNPQFGQQCVMNTPAIGRRFLYRAGKQFDIKKTGPSKTRPPHLSGIKFGPEATQSDPEHSIHFERGIYFTNTPVTLQDFENKDPSFGRLITVCEEINEAVTPTSAPIQVSGLTSGFTDLWSADPVSDFRNYMVYGEELSSLLDRGWTVVEAE